MSPRSHPPAKARESAPADELNVLAESVSHLTGELRILRQVLDEIRKDFSWVTQNGLPVRSVEYVRMKRMALDPCSEDWGDKLVIERSDYDPGGEAAAVVAELLDRVAGELKTTFAAVAKGQLGGQRL